MNRWRGRIALVTGASVGIGAAICRELVNQGMTIIGCARNVQQIETISEETSLKSASGRLHAVKCDLSKESEIASMFQYIRDNFGHIDVCINNAGLGNDAPLLSGNTDDWRRMLDVNVLALSICTREAVKLMQEKGIEEGHIVHVSSIGGHQLPQLSHGLHFYCGTKYMVRALTEGLRKELKEQDSKIRISSISPGIVETEFFPRLLQDDPNRETKINLYYKSIQSLQANDIAKAIAYILGTPPYVEIHDIILRPYDQRY